MPLGIRLTMGALALSAVCAGCVATQEWTQDLFVKRQAEVDQRFVKVETGLHAQGERIDRVEVRVADLGSDLNETRSMLNGVLTEKTNVVARTSPLPARTAAPASPNQRTLVGVINVPFAFDRADLDPGGEAALVAIVREVKDSPQVTLDLEGTTDPVGRYDYNVKLSQRRIEVVKRWLLEKGIAPGRIVAETARGPLADASVKNDLKRRVMVKLMRPED
jgi:outer membrane protein OmpA-like peptidoglycan-associated protein